MPLLRRAPREVYRVFSEDDFLDGAGSTEPFKPVANEIGEPRLRRIAGVAMLAGVLVVVLGLLVINGLPARTRGPAARAGAAAAHAFTPGEPHGAPAPWRQSAGSLRGDSRRRPARGAWRSSSAISAHAAALPAPSASPTEGGPGGPAGAEVGEFGFER
jgi:hypothetical protein